MKKILLGLLAMSAVSFAAQVNLGATATDGTNVFQTLQQGAISLSGKVTSDVPVIKYVVYASSDNGATKEDVVQLTDFVINHDTSLAGFKDVNPKVYVKRVTGTTGAEVAEDLNPTDVINFKISLDPSQPTRLSSGWLATSASYSISPLLLLAKADVEAVRDGANAKLGGTDIRIEDKENVKQGLFTVSDVGYYGGGKLVKFTVTESGILEITNGDVSEVSLRKNQLEAINEQFAGGKNIPANTKILVKLG